MSITALRDLLCTAAPGAGTMDVDVSALNRIVWHVAEDMTVKVEAGVKLNDLQASLAASGQWLPLDPWDTDATIKRIIDDNLHGPRRYGFGTVREHLIGMEMLLADGRLISAGGSVVKNVAGYDLMKLFIGSRQSLGVVVSATFKLWPLPRRETFLSCPCADAAAAAALTAALVDLPVNPVVMDWHGGQSVTVVTAFAGEVADVEWQLKQVEPLGFQEMTGPDYDGRFFKDSPTMGRRSVLPSSLRAAVEELNGAPFVARAGNGTIWSGSLGNQKRPPAGGLESRLKEMFDPRGIFSPVP